jgi:LPS export ABC transporter protein LptC
MKRTHWLLGLLALTALAVAFFMGHTGSTPGLSSAREEPAAAQYNFVANDVVVRQTGDDGQLRYRLEAGRVEQRPEDEQISASDLTVHYDSPEGKTGPVAASHWTLTATRAALPEDGKLLQLRGAVQVTGQPPAASAPVTMTTNSLDYDLQTQEVTSRDSVELSMGPQRLQGTGLQANIRLGTLSLESQVHARVAR